MRRRDLRPAVTPPPRWRFGMPHTSWLDNGLEVLVCQRDGQHIASVCLSFDVPLDSEPGALEGVATITQRCLDEGTLNHPGITFSEALEDIGAVLDGSVGFSASQLFLDVPTTALAQALSLLAEVVARPELAQTQVERHQELRLAEIDQTRASSARSAQLAFRKACIPRRYRASRMAGGTADRVAAITTADVHGFHATHYRPDGATLIITGDVSTEIYAWIEAAFGAWEVPGTVNPAHPTVTARTPHRWLIDRPGAVQADVRLGALGIDRADPRWADLQVASYAVGGAFLSRLNRVLREERGFTYGVHLVNQPMRAGGLLAVQGSFRTEVVAEAVGLAADLVDLSQRPITEDEVAQAVRYYTASAPLRYSTAAGVTQHLAALVAAGLSAEFIDANAYALTQVTPGSASAALSGLLRPDQLTLVVVGSAKDLTGPLAEAGWATTGHTL